MKHAVEADSEPPPPDRKTPRYVVEDWRKLAEANGHALETALVAVSAAVTQRDHARFMAGGWRVLAEREVGRADEIAMHAARAACDECAIVASVIYLERAIRELRVAAPKTAASLEADARADGVIP